MSTPLPERWGDAQIREAFIYDGGESEYRDPVNGASEQRRTAGKIFDCWLTEHDAALIDSLIEGIGSGTYTHQVGEGIEVALEQLHAAKAELREEHS